MGLPMGQLLSHGFPLDLLWGLPATGSRIGIGRGLTASPLPPHRTDGSRLRRFGSWRQGEPSPQPEHRVPECRRASFIPNAGRQAPHPRRMPSRRSTPVAASPLHRQAVRAHPLNILASPFPRLSAVGCLTSVACAGPTMPPADFSEWAGGITPPAVLHADTPQSSRGKQSRTVGA